MGSHLDLARDGERRIIPAIEHPAIDDETRVAAHAREIEDSSYTFRPHFSVGVQLQRVAGKGLQAGNGRVADAGVGRAVANGSAVEHGFIGVARDGSDGGARAVGFPDGRGPIGAGGFNNCCGQVRPGVGGVGRAEEEQNAGGGGEGRKTAHVRISEPKQPKRFQLRSTAP